MGEKKVETELENEDSTNSVADAPSPRDPADRDDKESQLLLRE
jgi:hypothetical protein